jgi:hypothetical protein
MISSSGRCYLGQRAYLYALHGRLIRDTLLSLMNCIYLSSQKRATPLATLDHFEKREPVSFCSLASFIQYVLEQYTLVCYRHVKLINDLEPNEEA